MLVTRYESLMKNFKDYYRRYHPDVARDERRARRPAPRPRGAGVRRLGLAIDVLGLGVGLAVDAERPPSTGRRNGPDRSER